MVDGDTFDLRIDLGFHTERRGRFRLAAVDAPELPSAAGRLARDFVHQRLLSARTLVVKTQRTDIYGRYVTHAFYSDAELPIADCFTKGTHLNNELLEAGHAELA